MMSLDQNTSITPVTPSERIEILSEGLLLWVS